MKTAVFSGTSDGKEICDFLAKMNIEADIFVATEYGKLVMPKYDGIRVFAGRLNENEITDKIKDYFIVIDATHPYAVEISKNIKNACLKKSVDYIRLLREIECNENFLGFDSIEDAVLYLNDKDGNIFVSTGSKEIEKFTILSDFKKRVFGRCIDSSDVIEKCKELGFSTDKFVFKKGPFSYDENFNTFKNFNIKFLVTKQTGKNGGFYEKIKAAEDLNISVILIKPPVKEYGYNMEEVKEIIIKKYNIGFKFPMFINLSGRKAVVIGCGNIGSRRVKILSEFDADVFAVDEFISDEIKNLNNVTAITRKFIPSDLENSFLVVAATDNRKVNHVIYNICKEKNIPVSVADSKEESTFFFPAICKNDDVVVGLTSNGTKHSTAKNIAEKIRKCL